MQRTLSAGRWHARLRQRGLLHLEGPDTRRLLQGLTTANVEQLDEGRPLYNAFLNAQGRVLGAGFLIPTAEGGVMLDVDGAMADPLRKHLSRYNLRSKVRITDKSDEYSVIVGSGIEASVPEGGGVLAGDGAAWIDTRLSCLGWRAVRHHSEVNIGLAESTEVSPSVHALCEALLGVTDNAAVIPPGSALPLESNIELLGGVSFSKGCYIGQELTARTHSRGVTRKRLMPVVSPAFAQKLRDNPNASAAPALAQLPPAEQAIAAALPLDEWAGLADGEADETHASPVTSTPDAAEGASITNADGKSLGKLRAYDARLGLGVALCRLEVLSDGTMNTSGGIELVAVRPSWWPDFVGS